MTGAAFVAFVSGAGAVFGVAALFAWSLYVMIVVAQRVGRYMARRTNVGQDEAVAVAFILIVVTIAAIAVGLLCATMGVSL